MIISDKTNDPGLPSVVHSGSKSCRFASRWMCLTILLVPPLPAVPVSAQQANSPGSVTRPCKSFSGELTKPGKAAKREKKSAKQGDAALANTCLELHFSSLDTQEYLQKYVRDKRWNVADEQTSEDAWTFTLNLSKEELLNFTKPFTGPKIDWHGGKALVQVRTSELRDGYTQAVVSARFDGFGESEDTFATKRESWPMESNGNLESTLLSALKSRFETAH